MIATGPESAGASRPGSTRVDDRRTLHLTFQPEPASAPGAAEPAPAPPRGGRGRGLRERALLVAERFLGGWAPTLRLALVMLVAAAAGMVVIGLVAGMVPALAGTGALTALTVIRWR